MRNYNKHSNSRNTQNVVIFLLVAFCIIAGLVFAIHRVIVNNYAYDMIEAEEANDSTEFVTLCRYATPEQMARYEKICEEIRVTNQEEQANLEFAVSVWNNRNK